jgi:hypothetical protein
LKCDFCSSPAVAWRYPAKSVVVFRVGNQVGESVGDWFACNECARLIEANDRKRLAEKSVETFPYGNFGADKETMLFGVEIIHQAFWLKRTGPKIPIGGLN